MQPDRIRVSLDELVLRESLKGGSAFDALLFAINENSLVQLPPLFSSAFSAGVGFRFELLIRSEDVC